MKHYYSKSFSFLTFFSFLWMFIIGLSTVSAQAPAVNFINSDLKFNGNGNAMVTTSLTWGPDDRLYFAEYSGTIKALTIERNGPGDYNVINTEVITGINGIQNHNDDGTLYNSNLRQTTGIEVAGTPTNPVIYVSSSDFRIGGGFNGGAGDTGLDTNSGVITRFTWNGASWDVVDIVRGLPRSEENHATNGMQFVTINGSDFLIVAQGGHTNAGSPSINFNYLTEYALSAAILSIDLTALESMPILSDNGRNYIYDIPTLDDPTRPNVNGIEDPDHPNYDGIDINDPFGGNDGLNQAMIVPGGPVQIFSPGYRNSYDLVITESGAVYVTENGANGGWGGFPENEGMSGNATNNYVPGEPGSSSPAGGEMINNEDHLHLITNDIQTYVFGSYYGGHPNPVRANPAGAGLYTTPNPTSNEDAVFRTLIYDPDMSRPGTTNDPSIALPANWPPVPVANANIVEGDWRGPGLPNPDGPVDDIVTIWGTNTNGITEYTASNFGGALKGNLLAGTDSAQLRRLQLNPDGSKLALNPSFASNLGGNALGVAVNGDDGLFPGTIWVGIFKGYGGNANTPSKIVVLEPTDLVNCIQPGDPGYDPNADYDNDGYTNQDEVDNGTNPCNGGSQPSDFDKAAGPPYISDLNDPDDDNDGIPDSEDPFQLGDPLTSGSDAFEIPIINELLSDTGLGGYRGLGLTGLMNNGDPNPNWLNWIDRKDDPNDPNPNDIMGGAIGAITVNMTAGTAYGTANNQEKGFQYGVQVNETTPKFTVVSGFGNFNDPLQLYGHTGAPNGELGIFIGDGFQSDYIKMVITKDGITALQEINDVPQAPINFTVPVALRPNGVVFYFVVDPSNGEVECQYTLVGKQSRTTLGTITASGKVLNALQDPSIDLAVGITGTSNAQGVELQGTWDFLNVLDAKPFVVKDIPNLSRMVNANDQIIELDNFFNDDNEVGNLTYSVTSNTNNSIGAVINGNELTLSFPGLPAVSDITIRATDTESNMVEQTFTVTVTDAPIALYRVNAGGPEIAAVDGGVVWEADTPLNQSQYLVTAGSNNSYSFSVNSGPNVPSTTPGAIFNTERADGSPGEPNITYSFPVDVPGNYEVRLYMGNGWQGTSEAGERIFDVTINGITYPTLNNLDLSGTYGHQVGAAISHIIPVNTSSIDISFIHGLVENPMVNGIEILDASNSETPIYVHPIADQKSNTGEQMMADIGVTAYGGDGNRSYTAEGLPPGLVIEPTNGTINGTVAIGAEVNSPYTVTITVDDSDGLTNDAVTISFEWVIIKQTSLRVNVGGAEVAATDNMADWRFNNSNGAYTAGTYSVNAGFSINSSLNFNKRDSSVPAYIDSAIFSQIYGRERYDAPSAPEMEFKFPLENGDYVVNLYMGNSYEGTKEVGTRIFDILIEGVAVKQDLDLITEFGHLTAGMLSFPVTLSDAELNILFNHKVENPTLNAIEIFKVDKTNPTLTLSNIANQSTDVNEAVNFTASASGGDPSEDNMFFISGQPDGISIDPSTGEISGTIAPTAASGGPNNNGVHQVVVTVAKQGSAPVSKVFSWAIASTWINKDEDLNYTPRHENSFVQAGDKFYLMGGRENSKTIDRYDYTSNTWTSLVNSAPFEFNHFQATEYQGLIWVIGSFKDNAYPTESPAEYVWAFDPAKEEWIQGPQIPANRRRGSAGLVMHNNKFYVVAGNTQGHSGGYVPYFDEFDPATGTWTPLADAPRARDHFAAVTIGDKMYVSGGRLSGGAGGVFAPTISEVDVYDFTNQTWSTLPAGQNIPTPRGGSSAVNFNNKLMVIGGEGENPGPAYTAVEAYDPVSQAWSSLPSLNSPRHGTQAIVSGNGVFILGGSPVQGGGNQKNMEYYGEDAPVGAPSVASDVNALSNLLVADGTTESMDLNIQNGNVGVMVTSMEISGPNAADFSIVSGNLTNQLLNPNSTHPIEISLSGTGANRNAVLTINYGKDASLVINLSNTLIAPEVTNPGTQNNLEGDIVSLEIDAIGGCTELAYSATGLPEGLTIDANTGVISGTISSGGLGGGAYQESNGLVVMEMENLNFGSNWTEQNSANGFTGDGYLFNQVDSFNTPGLGTITAKVNITTPGVYRFQWHNKIGITAPTNPHTEHNDAWLRFPDADNFFSSGVASGAEPRKYPGGLGKTPVVNGSTSAGWFKVYTNVVVWSWETQTSDNELQYVFVQFDTPGEYTMEISSRSKGHIIDRATLHKVDQNYTTTQLLAAPESVQGQGSNGAADNSPYNVEVTVSDNCDPSQSTTTQFVWNIGETGNQAPVAIAVADVTSGEAPLSVNFTGSNSTDDGGITGFQWDFKDGTAIDTTADPTHIFETPGVYEVELTVTDGVLTNTTTITITVNASANVAPAVIAPDDQNSVEGDIVSLQVAATDPDGDALSYSATGLPDGLTIDSDGLISGSIANGASTNSPYAVAITVTDNGTP
ncbi:malectin domain-containing carbohydrate-binding protein, partial [Arenibacter certesii]|uniref:malectin domain-containing carbohydrate-binding protein n=2 Tax=Arenibacter certesii TaxID=228955 RepID=UPI0009FE1E61